MKTFAFVVVAAFSLTAIGEANSQTYPSRPVRMLVPFSAGSQTDVLARLVGAKLAENSGQQVVVDNRPGAGGIVTGSILLNATPDGHTLVLHSNAFAVSAALYSKLPYDSLKDFAAVAQVASVPYVLVVAPGLGVKSVSELIAVAKQKSGQFSFGSAGTGSGTHMAGEQFKYMAGLNRRARAVQGHARGACRYHGWAYSVLALAAGAGDVVDQGRQVDRAGGEHRAAHAGAA